MDKEFYDKYINISEEEMIKGNIYSECRHMDKEDVYEWVYQDELKIKKQKEAIDKENKLINHYLKNTDESGSYVETYTGWKLIPEILKELLDILKEVSE